MEKWIDKNNCEIVRPDSKWDIRVPGHVVLMDTTDGTRVMVVPETFTDEQIWECLRIANIAYGYGHHHGERAKAREIKKALLIEFIEV